MDNSMDQVTKDAVKRKPPANPIIGQKRADEWDRKIDGIILDQATAGIKLNQVAQTALHNQIAIEAMRSEIASAVTWNKIRDVLQILLLVMILGLISFNTSQLWNWN